MSKKWLPYLLIVVLAIAVILIRRYQQKGDDKTTTKPKTINTKIDRNRGFDRRVSMLSYSNHAECRMKCRNISQSEVREIMQEGKINYAKSDLKNDRCPRYALEGRTSDAQRVRIVYAQCNESTTVVTVIDLDTDFECACAGDDGKYINKNRQ